MLFSSSCALLDGSISETSQRTESFKIDFYQYNKQSEVLNFEGSNGNYFGYFDMSVRKDPSLVLDYFKIEFYGLDFVNNFFFDKTEINVEDNSFLSDDISDISLESVELMKTDFSANPGPVNLNYRYSFNARSNFNINYCVENFDRKPVRCASSRPKITKEVGFLDIRSLNLNYIDSSDEFMSSEFEFKFNLNPKATYSHKLKTDYDGFSSLNNYDSFNLQIDEIVESCRGSGGIYIENFDSGSVSTMSVFIPKLSKDPSLICTLKTPHRNSYFQDFLSIKAAYAYENFDSITMNFQD